MLGLALLRLMELGRFWVLLEELLRRVWQLGWAQVRLMADLLLVSCRLPQVTLVFARFGWLVSTPSA